MTPRLCSMLLAAGMALMDAAPAPCQDTPSGTMAVGQRVRLTLLELDFEPLIGRIVSMDRARVGVGLECAPGAPCSEAVRVFPVEAIRRLEVSRGRRRNTLKGAGWGFAVGAAAGATLGLFAGDPTDCEGWCYPRSGLAVGAGALFGGVGALVGATPDDKEGG